MKWIGALLFIGITTWVGFDWSRKLSNRPTEIRQLKSALQILEAEMLYSQLPLRSAFTIIAKQIPWPTKLLFEKLASGTEGNQVDLMNFWESCVAELMATSSLSHNEKEVLMRFGRTLGQHYFAQQQKHIQLTTAHAERELEDARYNHYKDGKMAKSLGFLCGLFSVILLI